MPRDARLYALRMGDLGVVSPASKASRPDAFRASNLAGTHQPFAVSRARLCQ
jgi:hypothetical protein